MAADDAELVRRTRGGDRDAFAVLVDRYRDAVLGVAYHYLGRAEEVQDAAQEAFVRAYLSLAQLREPERFGPWLRRIAANVCAGILRGRSRAALSLDALAERDLPAGTPAPEEDVERLAARLVVRQALARLPGKTRLTVTLAYINGYSHEEIAGFLEVPVGTVRSRLQHAKRQLREEMVGMVSDELNASKPDPGFTRQVVEEAIRRGEEASAGNRRVDALRCYDEALAASDQLSPGPERDRLKMQALWDKARASEYHTGWRDLLALQERVLGIAEDLGDGATQAMVTEKIGITHYFLGYPEKREECYRRALQLFEELGDLKGQVGVLMGRANWPLKENRVAEAKRYIEQALPLAARAGSHDWVAVCKAVFDLLAEVGEERFASLVEWSATAVALEANQGAVSLLGEPGYGTRAGRDAAPRSLEISSVFYQVSHVRKFLDVSVPVGGSWSGDALSYSNQPLHTTVTVRSAGESVTVPAGAFENCLLMEQTTAESHQPDDAPERRRRSNRHWCCGTRRAWWAPGVGLVQLHVQPAEGDEATIQLQEHAIVGGEGYLPLAEGNTWTYGWADLPPEFVAKEFYRVDSHEGDDWYLERYHYVLKR
ncbi:MAG: sigma-70 family RNA polymerase sigma factor [Armatimonadetes bacterium]|nr:sigma-70 family RNA polymerase sigma factor [Armatimonadota bacterium]